MLGLPTVQRLPDGRLFVLPRSMAWAFHGGAYYETNVDHWLRAVAAGLSEPVFYDIGANVGYYSRRAELCKQTFAFEPAVSARRYLKVNRWLASRRDIVVKPFALADRSGEADLLIYSSSGNNSLHRRSVPTDHPLKLLRTRTVPLTRLDDLVIAGALPPPNIVKIDVEGGELAALSGAEQTLRTFAPIVFFELSEDTARDAGYSPDEILAFLGRLGYVFYGLSADASDAALYGILESARPIANVIAVRASDAAFIESLDRSSGR